MPHNLAFLLGLLADGNPAIVTAEDLEGEHGSVLRLAQRLGFLASESAWNPHPSCPHCQEGVPRLLGNRFLCTACQSTVDRRYLLLWRLDLDVLLRWLARSLALQGDVRQLDDQLWQLGSLADGQPRTECFFCRSGNPAEQGRKRLLAYRSAILFRALPTADAIDGFQGQQLSLLESLTLDRHSLRVSDPMQLLGGHSAVRFDEASGTLWAGSKFLGEVSLGSKEHELLACLWHHLDQYVPYSDLKHAVLAQTGSTDSTEEATFCQRLKSRIKKTVPSIDELIATTNKADGYRLRRLMGKPSHVVP